MKLFLQLVSMCGTVMAVAVAAAQTSSAKPPKAETQALIRSDTYRSAFDGYIGIGDENPIPWVDANALVKQIGGWRVYAREAQRAEAPGEPAKGANAPAAAASGTASDNQKPVHHRH